MLSAEMIRHMIEAIESDLQSTVDSNSVSHVARTNADPETIAYCDRSRQLKRLRN